MENWVSVKEVAKALTVSTRTIKRLIKEGTIPFLKVGNGYRLNMGHVVQALEGKAGSFNIAPVPSGKRYPGDEAAEDEGKVIF